MARLERDIIATPATTAREAWIALNAARRDFYQFNFAGGDPYNGDRFVMAGIEKALSLLKTV